MKAKRLTILLAICCIIACTLCLVACNGGDDGAKPSKQEPFTVTFETNGGTAIEPIYCTEAKSLEKILGDKTTEKAGQVFTGWYKDAGLQNKADLSVVIKENKTFYAGWRDLTDAEVLENAVLYAYKNAIAIKDVGYVQTGNTNADANSVNAVLTLDNGTITAGYNSTRYFNDGALYGVVSESKTKLIPNNVDEAVAYLYHNNIFKSLGYFDTFSPLVMGLAATDSACVFETTDDGFQVKYIGPYSAVRYTYVKYGTPYVFFNQCGKTFDFKIVDGKIVEVKHSGGSKTRTIQFFYEGDELPEVLEPEDINEYTQKWKLEVSVVGGGTKIRYVESLNKAQLDKDCIGDDYRPQTSKLTYYYDKDFTQPITFDEDGNATIDKHMTIYHPGIDMEDVTIAGFSLNNSSSFTKVGETTSQEGITTTTIRMDKAMSVTNPLNFTLSPRPYNAKNPTPIITFESTPDGEESLFEDRITVTPSSGGGYFEVEVAFPVRGTYKLKIVSDDGFVLQYIVILPKP